MPSSSQNVLQASDVIRIDPSKECITHERDGQILHQLISTNFSSMDFAVRMGFAAMLADARTIVRAEALAHAVVFCCGLIPNLDREETSRSRTIVFRLTAR